MLYMIRCDPKHPLYGALRVPYVQVQVTRGVVVAHRNNYVPPRCRTSQYHRTFISLSVYLWNDLCVYSMVWDFRVSRAGPMSFYWPSCSLLFLSPAVFPFSSFILWVVIVGLGSSDLSGVNHSLQVLHCQPILIIIVIIIIIE